ncbi:MAG: class I SAM-dependent methyltransferase [bacterium]|jgi:SAM-dependent methyltransferase|nr:class I SAM-dependent methyltransferase [bacterium]
MAAEPGHDPLASLLDGREWGCCLDLASGRGAFLGRLAALGRARAWLALDRDRGQLAECRVQVQPQPLPLKADAARPPLRPGSLDTVACSYSLHHLPAPGRALAAAAALLKPGGRLILSEPLADGLGAAQRVHRDLHHLAAALDRRRGLWHRPTLRLRELRALLADLDLDWRWICWPPPRAEERAPSAVVETMDKLEAQLARPGLGELRPRLAGLRRRLERDGYQGQTQFLAVGVDQRPVAGGGQD